MAVECPTKLYYTGKPKQYKDAMSENDFLRMLAEGGYQVGELASAATLRVLRLRGWAMRQQSRKPWNY